MSNIKRTQAPDLDSVSFLSLLHDALKSDTKLIQTVLTPASENRDSATNSEDSYKDQCEQSSQNFSLGSMDVLPLGFWEALINQSLSSPPQNSNQSPPHAYQNITAGSGNYTYISADGTGSPSPQFWTAQVAQPRSLHPHSTQGGVSVPAFLDCSARTSERRTFEQLSQSPAYRGFCQWPQCGEYLCADNDKNWGSAITAHLRKAHNILKGRLGTCEWPGCYKRNTSMTRHVRYQHFKQLEGSNSVCHFCHQPYSRPDVLSRHIADWHSGGIVSERATKKQRTV